MRLRRRRRCWAGPSWCPRCRSPASAGWRTPRIPRGTSSGSCTTTRMRSDSAGALIDDWAVARRRDRFALFARRLQPGGLGNLHLLNGLKRSGAVGGTEFQVRNVGDVALIFFAVEHVDVVTLHGAPPEGRVYFVACSISLVPKLCLGTHCPRNSVSRTASKSWRRRETGVSRTVGSQTGVWE